MIIVARPDAELAVDVIGEGALPVVLLHGLAGSAREMRPTAHAVADGCRVAVLDQRGHGRSTRRPADVSRRAFVDDVIAVAHACFPGERIRLAGQSMGAHTAFLTAAAHPTLVADLVLLEGHPGGNDREEEAHEIGAFFASWPTPFADAAAARGFLGDSALARAWLDDLAPTPEGLVPRFHADVMADVLRGVHEPRWTEWEGLGVPTLAVFADAGMFSAADKDDVIARRPATARVDLPDADHDAHLTAFEAWIRVLRERWGLDGG